MNIGSAIREIRQRRGITIAQICEGTVERVYESG